MCVLREVGAYVKPSTTTGNYHEPAGGKGKRFSCEYEEKFEHMSNRLQQLEITINLLEAKVRGSHVCVKRS